LPIGQPPGTAATFETSGSANSGELLRKRHARTRNPVLASVAIIGKSYTAYG
jgi:hypothetical protein